MDLIWVIPAEGNEFLKYLNKYFKNAVPCWTAFFIGGSYGSNFIAGP